MEKVYKVSEVAEMLQIGQSTLRKWMAAMQESGYPWVMDENGWGAILERDLGALRELKEALSNRSSLVDACREIADQYRENTRAGVSLQSEEVRSLSEKVDALVSLNQELIKRLEERDTRRDQMLMEALRGIQDVKQLTAPKEKTRKGFRAWFRRD